MHQTMFGKKLWYVVLGVVVLLGLIAVSARVPSFGVASGAVNLVTEPVEAVTSHIAAAIGSGWADIHGLWTLKQKNRALEAEVAVLQQELLRNSELEAENAQLTALVNAAHTPLPVGVHGGIAAAVVGRSPDNWFATLVVNKGSNAGVQVGMVAVDPTGLVGRVASVNPVSATIMLLSNPSLSVGAMLAGTNTETEGIVTGDLSDADVLMRFFSSSIHAPVGAKIVTSGLGGIYPPGLPIGVITSVGTGDFGFTPQAEVRPSAGLASVQAVLLLPQVPLSSAA